MVIASDCDMCGGNGTVGCDGECSKCEPKGFPCGTRMPSFVQMRFDFSESELVEAIMTAHLLGEYGSTQSICRDDAEAIARAVIAFAKKRDERRI